MSLHHTVPADRSTGKYAEYDKTYIPAFDDIWTPLPPPGDASSPTQSSPTTGEAGLGLVLTAANLFVTIVLVAGMLINGEQVGRALVVGAIYFTITTPVYAVIATGSLTAIVTVWQRERTERHRIDAYADTTELALTWRIKIEENRMLELQAQAQPLPQLADPVQTGAARDTFVPAYDNRSAAAFVDNRRPDTTAQEAINWVNALYLPTGQPDPAQVQTTGERTGWLKTRMLSSKRGTGSAEAGLWLLQRHVILRAPGGYKLNLTRYPTRDRLRALL